jgi:hypothetical protein
MDKMVFSRLTVLLLLASSLVLAAGPSSAEANTFVSFNGQFLFSYPETWMQIDYTTAEYYLTRGKPDQEVDFEAVFSVRETMVLFQGQYLILTVDTLGALTPEQIDSVVAVTSEEFKHPVKEVSSDAFMTGSCGDSILFDRGNGLLAVETAVQGNEASSRVNLLVMKFYPRGIANFYFYSPETEFAAALTDYRDMVMSFSTENLDQALGRDSVKIAEPKGEREIASKYIFMFAGLVVIILAILVVRAKRAKN